MSDLVGLTWSDVPEGATVLVPVGSTEQHGPHLPLDTDTQIAVAVSRRVVRMTATAVVAPAIAYGSSGEHQSFAGTTSIGTEVLRQVLVETVRSARTWAQRVLFVNGHGGNVPALTAAVTQLRHEQHDVAWAPCAAAGADLHAGASETSLMLHLSPDAVRLDRARKGDLRSLEAILPTMVIGGVEAVSPTGVLGDPTRATAAEGARLLGEMMTDFAHRLGRWNPDDRGMLIAPQPVVEPA